MSQTPEQIAETEFRAAASVFRLGRYRHYKGGLYIALALAADSANGSEWRPLVVYVSCDRGAPQRVRPLSEWSDYVAADRRRFEFVGEALA